MPFPCHDRRLAILTKSLLRIESEPEDPNPPGKMQSTLPLSRMDYNHLDY
jgi:hypothetical protein